MAGVAVYIQNKIIATVHRARPSQDGRAICEWNYKGQTFRARRHDARDAYITLNSLVDIPGSLMCDRCLPSEKTIAFGNAEHDLSGDESECTARACTKHNQAGLRSA